MSNKQINIYSAETDKSLEIERQRLNNVLIRAGLKLVTMETGVAPDVQALDKLDKVLQYSDCSIHLIGDEYDYVADLKMSFTEYQINKALEYVGTKPWFKIFIWRPGYLDPLPRNPEQRNLWFSLRNKITSNIVILNHHSPILVAEDIRTIMSVEQLQKIDTEQSEIYLMYNEIDEQYATQVIDLLQDVATVAHTEVSLSADLDYEHYVVEQIKASVLPVIYFRKASSWASFFVQQVWRLIGGASFDKIILFVGDDAEPENLDITFDAPNVQTIITGFELIPLEIKVQLDRIKEEQRV